MSEPIAERETPVLIVGGGPAGLALAAELGWRGAECVLVEQTDGAIHTPKMNEVNTRTMEFCRRWGIDDQVMNCPFPADYPMDIVFVTSLGGYELGRMKRPARRDQRPGPHSPMNLQACSQLWFDPMLRRLASSFASVTLLHRCRLDRFEDTGDGVTAEVTHVDSGARERIHARFLAACDGGTSAIRRQLDIPLDGTEVLGRPVHFYFRAPGLLAAMGREPGTFFLAIDRDGLWANIRVVDPANHLWRLMVLDSDAELDPATVDPEPYLRRALGRDVAVEWVGISVWTRRGVVARRYREGNVFLAGDAVHQLSPTGALGMNTGIGDAVDLGWKLAAVQAGWGGTGLLDSYDPERRGTGARNVGMATEFYNDHLGYTGGVPWIEDDTQEAEARRRALGGTLVENVARMFRSLGLQIGYRYDESPICVADGSGAPPDDPAEYRPTARPGARAPHAWLADGRSTLDLFGRGFTLLRFGGDAPDPAPLATAAAARGVPLEVADSGDPAIARLYERALVLVRPDGHVAWRGDAPPADSGALIDRVRGAA